MNQLIEFEAPGVIDGMIGRIAEKLTTGAARQALRMHIRDLLSQGTISTAKVIEAAQAGHAEADWALRELIADKVNHDDPLPALLKGYNVQALLHAPVTY